MLSPYRVLDLTDERGHLAGMMLAALGADVIKIEPPEGVRSRRIGPFDDQGRSLSHAAYDRGKTSVVLDLTTDEGRADFLELVTGADVLIESQGPGVLDALGLGFEVLQNVNPALVMGTVTAFGHDGPKAHWPATDLTLMASACTMAFTGDNDRSPVRVTVPQAFHFGSAVLAGAVVAALYERGTSGTGQLVDVAAQEVIPIAVQAGVVSEACNFTTPIRTGGGLSVGPIDLRLVYPAADGFVSITHVFGDGIGPVTARLMQWVAEEGFVAQEIADLDWVNMAVLLETGEVSIDTWEEAKAGVQRLTSSKTKAELLSAAMERRLLVAPISDSADVLASEQLAARGYLHGLDLGGDVVQAPGRFAQCSVTPLRELSEVSAMGSGTEAVLASPRPAPDVSRGEAPARPLEGVKVLDFMWSLAGPFTTRTLADLGATVVKVESVNKADAARGFLPIWDNEPGLEQSALFDTANAGKLSIALDMRTSEARDVVRDLVAWADLVCESFSPRAMGAWDLGYDALRAINPNVIMFSTCLTGQYGPLANFAGYGNLGAALSGFYNLAGWPDRPPSGPFGAYTDYTSTHLMVAVVLAALDHRRRTGQGQLIDLAQAEAAIHFIAPAMLETAATGRVATRDGNRDPQLVPHGGYRCAGDDRWIAIAAEDTSWPALAAVIGRDDWVSDPGLAEASGRRVREAEIDAAIEAWTSERSVADAEGVLIGAGVAAHGVQSSRECLADPQLEHRGHWKWFDQPTRRSIVENVRFKMSRSEVGPPRRSPLLGEHTFEVLTDFLSYDTDRIADLAAAQALE